MSLSVEQSLQKAKRYKDDGKLKEAAAIYEEILKNFPKNKDAILSLEALQNKGTNTTFTQQEPPENQVQAVINLFTQGLFKNALEEINKVQKLFPNSVLLHNICGATYTELGQFDQAIKNYEKALLIKPGHADALCNMGIAKQKKGDFESSIKIYKKAIQANPNHFTAYYNMGISYKAKGDSETAISCYKKVIKIQPRHAAAYNNMGTAYSAERKLETAINCFKQAIEIKPNFDEAFYNMGKALVEKNDFDAAILSYKKAIKLKPGYAEAYNGLGSTIMQKGSLEQALAYYEKALRINPKYDEAHNNMGNALRKLGQLDPAINSYRSALNANLANIECYLNYETLLVQISSNDSLKNNLNEFTTNNLKTCLHKQSKHQILEAINNYMIGDFTASKVNLKHFLHLNRSGQTKAKDKLFCEAYSGFITNLLKRVKQIPQQPDAETYHLGESHCLSYAHSLLKVQNKISAVTPLITFGAKAYHFAKKQENEFKAITKRNLQSLPFGSNVFLSFGEIDCRHDEGFLLASAKTGQSLEKLIKITVSGYVSWFDDTSKDLGLSLYFLNVPAPTYLKTHSSEFNSKAVTAVRLFNKELEAKLLKSRHELIDVCGPTQNKQGFSNGIYHCDSHHLDNRILSIIENQLK